MQYQNTPTKNYSPIKLPIAKTHNCMNKIFKFFFIFPLILSLLFATVPDSSTVVNFFISYNPYIFNHKYMNDTNGTQQI